jgi:hypothetical protein
MPSSTGPQSRAVALPRESPVSDHERQEAADELRVHFADGRIDVDEFSSRLDEVWAAETVGDLAAALRQLPAAGGGARPWEVSTPAPAPWVAPERRPRDRVPGWLKVLAALAVVVVVLFWWPVWVVLLVGWLVFVRPHHHRYHWRSI